MHTLYIQDASCKLAYIQGGEPHPRKHGQFQTVFSEAFLSSFVENGNM